MSWWRSLFRKPSSRSAEVGELAEEQRLLADEVERICTMWQQRVEQLSEQIHGLQDSTHEGDTQRCVRYQRDLLCLLQRIEASTCSTQRLQREFAEWEDRIEQSEENDPTLVIRAEVIRSELEARRCYVEMDRRSFRRVFFPTPAPTAPEMALKFSFPTESPPYGPSINPTSLLQALPRPETEHLLAAIREATHEAERWHALPEDLQDEDAVFQLHHVKALHAVLKREDRRNGIVRDRMAYAIRMRVI